jgi:hypothetical protein
MGSREIETRNSESSTTIKHATHGVPAILYLIFDREAGREHGVSYRRQQTSFSLTPKSWSATLRKRVTGCS